MEAIALLGKGVLVAGSQAAHASPADMSDQQRAHAHLVDLCTHPEGLPGDDELCAGVDDTEHMTQEWMRLEQVMRMRRQPTLLTPRVRFMPAYFQMLDEAQGLEVPQSMASGGRSVAQL
ncbi:hypothetical protein ABBQ38_014395 [Trebouxia sp. C0009 RCD-2024]